jgi:transketolase
VTHYGLEDVADMRSLPYMKVMSPADPWEAKLAAEYALENGGPAYIRVNRSGEADIMENKPAQVDFSNPILINEGNNGLVIFSTGNVTSEACKAVKSVAGTQSTAPTLYSVPLLKPLNVKNIIEIIKDKKVVITVEEHTIVGGLGTTIAEIIAENMLPIRLVRLGTPDAYFDFIGKQDYMRDAAGISADKIEKVILEYE